MVIFNIICFLLIFFAVYTIVLVATNNYKMNKQAKLKEVNNTINSNTSGVIDIKEEDNKIIEFKKDSSSVIYFILAIVCIGCIYSAKLSNLFLPLFSKVYYGNLNGLFLSITSIIIWIFEIFGIDLFCRKKLDYQPINDKDKNIPSISLLRIFIIFILTFIPILIISAMLGWELKIVDDFGEKIESVTLSVVASGYVASLFKMVLMILTIRFFQIGMSKIIKTKVELPWGGLLLMLTFGLIEFFVTGGKFAWMYLIFNLIFGIIYLVANKRFSTTYWVSYILYLL